MHPPCEVLGSLTSILVRVCVDLGGCDGVTTIVIGLWVGLEEVVCEWRIVGHFFVAV